MKKTIKIVSVLTIVLLLSAFSINKNIDRSGYQVGDIATDFKLMNIDGNMVSLADFKNAKGFIVIFTCNTCP